MNIDGRRLSLAKSVPIFSAPRRWQHRQIVYKSLQGLYTCTAKKAILLLVEQSTVSRDLPFLPCVMLVQRLDGSMGLPDGLILIVLFTACFIRLLVKDSRQTFTMRFARRAAITAPPQAALPHTPATAPASAALSPTAGPPEGGRTPHGYIRSFYSSTGAGTAGTAPRRNSECG